MGRGPAPLTDSRPASPSGNLSPCRRYKLQTDRGIITVRAKDLTIPFHALDFDYAGKQVYVYFCLWEDRLKSREQLRIRDHWDDRLVGLESAVVPARYGNDDLLP